MTAATLAAIVCRTNGRRWQAHVGESESEKSDARSGDAASVQAESVLAGGRHLIERRVLIERSGETVEVGVDGFGCVAEPLGKQSS